MFSEFPLSQSFIGLVAYKTLGSPGMGRLWSEKNRPPDLDQVVARRRKRFKGRTRGNNPREFTSRQVVASNQASASFVGGARSRGRSNGAVKTRSSAETQTLWGVLVRGLIPSCRNRGRIWGHSLIGAQYCYGFRWPDVYLIPARAPRDASDSLRANSVSGPGALPSENRTAGVRSLNQGVSVEAIDRAKVHEKSRSYRKMVILRYSGIKTLVQ